MQVNYQKVLQLMLAQGAMTDAEFKKSCGEIFGSPDFSESELDNIRQHIALSIRPFALDVKRCMCDDGKMYCGVVNTSNDDMAKMSNIYKPWEIILFRKAIEHIVENEDGEIDRTELLNLRDGTGLAEVRLFINRLVQEKWLAPSILNNDLFTLGPRVFLELTAFIRELGVPECSICHSDVVQGVRCKTADCTTRVHELCIKEHERAGRNYHCPHCRKPLR